MSMVADYGRTRLHTRRDRARLAVGAFLFLLGAALSLWVGAGLVTWLSGNGWTWPQLGWRSPIAGAGHSDGLLGLPREGRAAPTEGESGAQFPITLSWPTSFGWSAAAALPLWAAWTQGLVRPLVRGRGGEARKSGFATVDQLDRQLSANAARRKADASLPSMPAWRRWLASIEEFGLPFGTAVDPKRRGQLVANWESPIRIVARPGWGKTQGLLVPIIRRLPGAALISSIEPQIFDHTVGARHRRRRRLRWPWLTRLSRRWLPEVTYPIWIADFSPAGAGWAAGWPRVRWSPIPGCESFELATRRASAMVAGIDTSDRGGRDDAFFRQSATAVLAALFHAAAHAGHGVEKLGAWLNALAKSGPLGEAIEILDTTPEADPSALQAIRHHLDARADRTTAGVVRYLTLALTSLVQKRGREFCGGPHDQQFDMEELVRAGGTVYLLSNAQMRDVSGPLLSLFANEMFYAAQAVAQRLPSQRLEPPFVAVLDELRYGVTVDQLAFVTATMRKNGVDVVYATQTADQEVVVYGEETANELRGTVGVTIYGGIDQSSARELTEVAGRTKVVRGGHQHGSISEHIVDEDVLTVADQQRLTDGQAVVRARSLPLFIAEVSMFVTNRRNRRQLDREAARYGR
jgi:type IV secretion system protein VirD4